MYNFGDFFALTDSFSVSISHLLEEEFLPQLDGPQLVQKVNNENIDVFQSSGNIDEIGKNYILIKCIENLALCKHC